MNSFLISICLMFSFLPFCDVENISNNEFAEIYGYKNFEYMNKQEKICSAIALEGPEMNDCLGIGPDYFDEEVDLEQEQIDKLELCRDELEIRIDTLNQNMQSAKFKKNNCTRWLIGMDDNHLAKEYKRRKEELN